ncbi:MAG: hypothetical protein WAU86_16260 [Oricola sp.]
MTHANDIRPFLIVEDDPLIALDAEDCLRSAGFDCLVAHDVEAARRFLEERDVCAVILDYDLGKETSIGIAERASRRPIPFAFVTGRHPRDIGRHDIDPVAVFGKPVDYVVVARALAGPAAA